VQAEQEVRATELGFLPDDPGFVANPYPVYERLREDHPVLYDDATNHWLVSRWADVNSLLRDRRFGRTYLHLATHEEMGHAPDPPHLDPFWHLIRSGILDMEPPDHTRVRRLVSKAFTPKTVEQLKPSVESIVLRLVEDVRGTGEFDLISRVAEPLPVEIIAEMLGVPESERHHLRPWSAEICLMYELNPSPEYERRAVTASVEFTEFLRELARDRRRTPRDDLITRLTQVVDDGRTLSEDELVGTCVLLLNAGHEATVNATGNGWWALFRNSDQLERLRGDQSLLPRTVEELLRYDTPLQMFERWVLEDVEIHGHRIPRGAELGLLFGSANHDPSVFADPWELDLGRDPNPHVTFGAGIHFCLGAPLARVELETSLRTLLENVPDMELVAEPQWKPGYIIRGLEALHVRG